MAKPALIAQIAGEAYRHMLDWRNEVNLQLIQFQLDRDGEAHVIVLEPRFGIRRITELPAPGMAQPHVGTFGGGYEYGFLHGSAGWMLRVTNTAQRSFRFEHITPIPPILIDDTTAINVTVEQINDPASLYLLGLMDDSVSDRTPTDRASFPIARDDYNTLVAWGWTPQRLAEYEYRFIPLSVGCEIIVEHPASGRRNHLTKDVMW